MARGRSELLAECHRLYALLHPQGRVQVVVAPAERSRLEAQYRQAYDALADVDEGARAASEKAQEVMDDIEDAIPMLMGMLPDGPWKARVEGLRAMAPGAQRDDALRAAFREVASSPVIMQRLGPMGVVLQPMLQKYLRTSSRRARR